MSMMFGYILNTIGNIMDEMSAKQQLWKRERESVNRFIKKRKIPDKLKDRVVSYLEYL
jgi:hypothetical protein